MPDQFRDDGQHPSDTAQRRRLARRGSRAWAVCMSLMAHLAVVLAILAAQPVRTPPFQAPERLIELTLVEPPRPRAPPAPVPGAEAGGGSPGEAAETPQAPAPPEPTPPEPKTKPTPPRPSPPRPRPTPVRPVPAPPQVAPAPFSPPVAMMEGLSDAQLVGATRAGSGGGGGGGGSGGGSGSGVGAGAGAGSGTGGGDCDMVARLQRVLRQDAGIQAAAAEAQRSPGMAGKAILVWNGDWVQTPGQAGKGLAGVRQAIAVEVAFAPDACRRQAMSGYVLLTLGDHAGAPRVALGTGRWRWSDLLGRR